MRNKISPTTFHSKITITLSQQGDNNTSQHEDNNIAQQPNTADNNSNNDSLNEKILPIPT